MKILNKTSIEFWKYFEKHWRNFEARYCVIYEYLGNIFKEFAKLVYWKLKTGEIYFSLRLCVKISPNLT